MLNRRSLRVKAMQRLFAFHQSRHSELEAAIAVIRTLPVEAGEEGEFDRQAFEEEQAQVVKVLKKFADRTDFEGDKEYSDEVNQKAKDTWQTYRKKVVLDQAQQRKRMLAQVEEVPKNFRRVLQLFVTLYLYAMERKNKQTLEGEITDRPLLNLLNKDSELQGKDYSWDIQIDQVRQWYREFKDDPGFNENQKLTFEEDVQALRSFSKMLFKSESFNKFYEQEDLFWQEDKAVIKSLVNKTLKAAQPSSLELAPLSYNWEEDKEFFKNIFDSTLDHEEETEKWIAEKAENWDMDRIALLDRILLKMALVEMINFPSIPIKVTINEYIELSKIYSTPKSKKFVNGLLDVLAADLQEQGRIKKSGRGLIDNK